MCKRKIVEYDEYCNMSFGACYNLADTNARNSYYSIVADVIQTLIYFKGAIIAAVVRQTRRSSRDISRELGRFHLTVLEVLVDDQSDCITFSVTLVSSENAFYIFNQQIYFII